MNITIKNLSFKRLCLTFMFATSLFIASVSAPSLVHSAEPKYTYHENDGIFLYYETQKKELYRELLPDVFDMPDRLLVHAFVVDFYKMDARTVPYKEGAIFLLAKYQGKDVWHCITMPVTSNESRLGGVYRLGLPKIMGDINFARNGSSYSGAVLIDNNAQMSINLNAGNYTPNAQEEQRIKELVSIPRYNILNGKVFHMKRKGEGNGKVSIFDIAKKFPNRLTLKFGQGTLSLTPPNNGSKAHAFGLTPDHILGAYYLKNTFKFRLGKG